MRIKKIFNNNVVMVEQSKNQEMIVRGKGIAFQKKRGDEIAENDIEKTYILNNQPELFQKFQEIIAHVDSSYLKITDQVVKLAQEAGLELDQVIYVNLPDHLSSSVNRMKEGMVVHNSLLSDIRRFYPTEYHIAKEALAMVEEEIGEILPIDEAGYIAAHIINASLGTKRPIMDAVIDILNAVQQLLSQEQPAINRESVYYDRFMTHLKYFAQRIVQNDCSSKSDDGLAELIASKYPTASELTQKISCLIEKQYHYSVCDEERMYLTIHLAKLLNQ